MKNFLDLLKGKAPGWLAAVIASLALAYVIAMGGSTTQEFPGKNGSEYEVQLQIPEGVMELIEQCKLKEVGQECEVAVNVKVKMTKAPDVAVTEPEKKPETPVKNTTPVKDTTDNDPKPKPEIPIDVKKEIKKVDTPEKVKLPIKKIPVSK